MEESSVYGLGPTVRSHPGGKHASRAPRVPPSHWHPVAVLTLVSGVLNPKGSHGPSAIPADISKVQSPPRSFRFSLKVQEHHVPW